MTLESTGETLGRDVIVIGAAWFGIWVGKKFMKKDGEKNNGKENNR